MRTHAVLPGSILMGALTNILSPVIAEIDK